MSGHSKWHSIKHKKAAADHKRGKIFTKLGRAITIAAKQGGDDPDTNFSLRLAIQKARSSNMPKDNIERAIKRGTGDTDGEAYEEVLYEGHGPDNGAVIIEALTDNRNRTVAEIKHTLSKHGGNLGSSGAVMWQFDHRGMILLQDVALTDEIETAILESDALDYSVEDTNIEIITKAQELELVKNNLEQSGLAIAEATLAYLPKEYTGPKRPEAWEKFMHALEDLDDVQTVHTNIVDANN